MATLICLRNKYAMYIEIDHLILKFYKKKYAMYMYVQNNDHLIPKGYRYSVSMVF